MFSSELLNVLPSKYIARLTVSETITSPMLATSEEVLFFCQITLLVCH